MDSCVVLRAGLILRSGKEERKMKLFVNYWDFCKSPFLVCSYRENISSKNGTEA